MTNWELLPELALCNIFRFLCDRDRLLASRVCQAWRQAASCPCIWRYLHVHVDTDLLQEPDPLLHISEPLAIHLVRNFGAHVRHLELVWPRPVSNFGIFKYRRGEQVDACTSFLALLRNRNVQLRRLALTDWMFTYKSANRSKLLFALIHFLSSQHQLEELGLENACLGVGEAMRIMKAILRQSASTLKALDLRRTFREWQAPYSSVRYLQIYPELEGLRSLSLDYHAVSDELLAALSKHSAGTLRLLRVAVRDSDSHSHWLSDGAWAALAAACPALGVQLGVEGIAHHEDLRGFLAPALPLCRFSLHSGFVWDQSRSRNFRATLHMLIDQYARTLTSVHLQLRNNCEELDDVLLELLIKCINLIELQFEGILMNMDTVQEMCRLQLNNLTRFRTMHVRHRNLNPLNRNIVESISNDYTSKLADRMIDFKIEDYSPLSFAAK